MKKPRIAFMPREEFSALSLHERNLYLQDRARAFMEASGEEFVPLTKDALSHLRCSYSRRS